MKTALPTHPLFALILCFIKYVFHHNPMPEVVLTVETLGRLCARSMTKCFNLHQVLLYEMLLTGTSEKFNA